MPNPPDWSCPGCEHSYEGHMTTKVVYAGEGCNPSLCLLLDKLYKKPGYNRRRGEILRHWKHGDCVCPAYGRKG